MERDFLSPYQAFEMTVMKCWSDRRRRSRSGSAARIILDVSRAALNGAMPESAHW
jgi:hypothetical protein